MSAEILLQALTAAFNQGIPVAIEIDVRLLVAIRADRIDISPTTRPARLDDDEVLAMVWEMATRAVPGSYIYIDKIV